MSQEVSRQFLVVCVDGVAELDKDLVDAKARAKRWVQNDEVTTKVYHLDFTTNKMTLIKEYRRRTEADEEGIVEYV